ncbi:hypothetical protein HPP92_020693 [Vanilla planifolia]|uniref:non-specific serine/threonine protein kinase n=1 Tax=Vanilla planifolia TaxID=51239 RepID=A0A835UHU5_VANPL|nr:hypothetical protein HPP92_020693 [Vanilla planifolia]
MTPNYLSQGDKGPSGFHVLRICIPLGATAGLFLGFLLFFWIQRRKKRRRRRNDWPMIEIRQYQFDELEKATEYFSEERLIGSGAFGNVYKGYFDEEKRTLAIKIAHADSYESFEEFHNEIDLLSRVEHKNLVNLVGYCADAGQRALVYEYVSHGSLLEYILGKERKPLTWQQRVNIAIGSAKGIAHLHEEVKPSIIHRDIKPSNILINEGFEAKVSDFGLAKKGPEDDASHVSTQPKGTPGYLDPAYFSTLRLSPSSDVYSFGVILLQLVSACPALDHMRNRSQYHIIDWAKPSVEKGFLEDIVDPSLLLEACDMKVMLKIAQLGLRCTTWEPNERPTMRQVVRELEESLRHAMRKLDDGEHELESISIEGVTLQRFYVGSFDISTSLGA